jgi:dual specificity protein kinase YAK1
MDHAVPPQIARIASLGMEVSGIKRNTLTPVLNRDEAIKEWERRASGQRPPPGPVYPQLEYLQQQAELVSTNSWNGAGGSTSRRYHPPSSLQHFQSPPSALTVDSTSSKHHRELSASGGLRDVSMASISSRQNNGYDQTPSTNLPPAPPQAYSGSSASARYGVTSQPLQQQPSSYQPSSNDNSIPYDAYDHRDGLGTLYTPMQPNVLSSGTNQQQMQFSTANNDGNLASASSFYGGGVVPSSSQQQPMINIVPNQRQQPPPQSHQTGEWSR